MQLTPTEIQRYSRHFPVITPSGQAQLKNAAVLCIGAGGLGCPALQYLAAAGIGKLGIVDHDLVELSNLQRQILYTEADIGQHKVDCARQRLLAQNSHIEVVTYPWRLTRDNAAQILTHYDVILDGSDNYPTRYLVNDVCHQLNKPLISASIAQFQGQIGVFNYQDGPCYRCLYHVPPPPELTPDCATGGVLGVLPGLVGTMQAVEAIKLILNLGHSLAGRLLAIDALAMSFKEYVIQPDPQCPLCRHNEQSDALFAEPIACPTRNNVPEVEPHQLMQWLLKDEVQLLDVREPFERAICDIGGELLPLSHFDVARLNLAKEKTLVVYCKHGMRSQQAGRILQASGYSKVFSLAGGIIAWAQQVDAELTIY